MPLTPLYFVIYTFCGISDVLDGWIARHMGAASDLVARLDSIGDLFFYTVMIIQLLPILWQLLPGAFWVLLGGSELLLSFAQVEEICGLPIDHSFLNCKKELLAYGWQVKKISLKQQTVALEKLEG